MKNIAVSLCLVALVAGCGGAKGKVKAGTTGATSTGKLGRIDEGSRCETGKGRREVLVDLNQDGQPDVRKVYVDSQDGETLSCREADLNFDNTKDLFVFFDELGNPTRDEVDLDFDGQVDIISTYAKGKIVKQNIDSNSDGMVDRVRFLEDDVPIRVEGDQNGDGQVDYWEYYEAGKLIRVGEDRDGDGRADQWARDDEAERSADEEEAEAPAAEAEDKPEEEGAEENPADEEEGEKAEASE